MISEFEVSIEYGHMYIHTNVNSIQQIQVFSTNIKRFCASLLALLIATQQPQLTTLNIQPEKTSTTTNPKINCSQKIMSVLKCNLNIWNAKLIFINDVLIITGVGAKFDAVADIELATPNIGVQLF